MTLRLARARPALTLLLALPVVVGACSAAGESAATAGTGASGATASTVPAATSSAPAPTDGDSETTTGSAATSWLDIELTDVATGETFTLASLAGQVLVIEPMAIWCPSCKEQQDVAKEAYSDIREAGATYISLGVDPTENASALARYAEQRGYPWTFVKAPTKLARALADLFGSQILSPPSTPLIVLDASGEVVVREFGRHGARELLGLVAEAS